MTTITSYVECDLTTFDVFKYYMNTGRFNSGYEESQRIVRLGVAVVEPLKQELEAFREAVVTGTRPESNLETGYVATYWASRVKEVIYT